MQKYVVVVTYETAKRSGFWGRITPSRLTIVQNFVEFSCDAALLYHYASYAHDNRAVILTLAYAPIDPSVKLVVTDGPTMPLL